MHGESSSKNYQKNFQRSTTSLVRTGKTQTFQLVFLENVICRYCFSKIYGRVVVVAVLPDPFRGMGAWRNSAKTQQSGHNPRSGP